VARISSEEWKFNLSKSKINYEKDIDENLREIIRLLNEIPWLRTLSCCEGHSEAEIPRYAPVIRGYFMVDSFDEMKLEYELLPFLAKRLNFKWAKVGIMMNKRFVLEKKECKFSGWRFSWFISPANDKLKKKFLNNLETALQKFLKTKSINDFYDPSCEEEG